MCPIGTSSSTREPQSVYVRGTNYRPAGYVELERRDHGDVEIAYLGLLTAFAGDGMGAHLLSGAVDHALAMGARNVLVNTCTLDSDSALPNYLARGFVTVREVTGIRNLPDVSPGPWDGA